MAGSSSLDPDNLSLGPDRVLGRGHGTGALGPSDTSDSGSDVQGAPGAEFGDAELGSDSDAAGTGERAAAGGTTSVADGADINVDHIERLAGDDDDARDEVIKP